MWQDGEQTRAEATYGGAYEGPPGCLHGGIVMAAFDDVLGVAQAASGAAGMTGTLTVRMVRPTPLHERIDYVAGVTSRVGRKIEVTGTSTHRGTLLAEATAVFVAPRPGAFPRTH
jgi:acyl-coenzyme A thioesterase PaaI-like protein